MGLKVSVVVPVYNPGRYIDACVRALLGQSLPRTEYELIFVDDGSTDGAGQRLDGIAAKHPGVRVIHQSNSGWPGKPRNVGMDAARGEYVYFADADDQVRPEALERMYALATRNDADIVVAKIVGHHRGSAKQVFARNRDRATFWDTPLIESLTVQKLFRRRFLEEQQLRFREGRRRLEDMVFVLQAYFAASTISVLADYTCYVAFWRSDAGNITKPQIDPPYYYRYLREPIAIIEEHLEAGERRDALLTRFVRAELVGRLRGRTFLGYPDELRQSLFDEIRKVVVDHIGRGVDALVPPIDRVRLALVRAGRLDVITELARGEDALRAVATVSSADRLAGGVVRLAFEASMDGFAAWLPIVRRGDSLALAVPDRIAEHVTDDTLDAGSEPPGEVRLTLRRTSDSVDVLVPMVAERRLAADAAGGLSVSYRIQASIDPATLGADGGPLELGDWELRFDLDLLGAIRETAVGATRAPSVPSAFEPIAVRGTRARATSSWSDRGPFVLRIRPASAVARARERSTRWLRRVARVASRRLPPPARRGIRRAAERLLGPLLIR
jgi:poly(ribitol-phosphate) beta-N-acetylglucosaminyltransferase